MRVRVDGRGRGAGVLPVAAGVVAGFVAGWWMGRRSMPTLTDEGIDTGWADRWGARVDQAVDAAADGFRSMERRWRAGRPLDGALLEASLTGVEGTDGLRVRHLGEGVVEIAGDASDDAAALALEAVRRVPGVRVAVDRIWTPSSARPGQIDAVPGFG